MHLSTNRLVVLVCLVLVGATAGPPEAAARPRPAALEVTCQACVVVDDNGRTLWARRAHARLPNASTTKMMTALIVVDAAEEAERVTVSPVAAATGGGGLDLEAGDVHTVDGLLHALLMTSSNDAAVALAEHVSGSVDRFVAAMNARARTAGLHDTRFETPHGLDVPGHYSSPADLAALAEEVLDDPALAEIVGTGETSIRGPRGLVRLDNRNLLLDTYPGAIGVKTGYTALAGNVLVGASRRQGRTLIAVAMDSIDPFADNRALLDHGFEVLRRTVLLRAAAPVGSMVFDSAGATEAVAARSVRGMANPRLVTVSFEPSETALPLEAGDPVGTAEVMLPSGRVVEEVRVVAAGDVHPSAPSWGVEVIGGLLRAAHRFLGLDPST